jgi:DNA-binding response OmpR family regulator
MTTILIVDDNLDMLEMIADTLEMTGFKVIKASNGEIAWEVISSFKNPHGLILLSDVKMPKVNGFELLRRVRNTDRLAHIPVLLMSGDQTDSTAALAARADDFVLKPFRVEVLQQKLSAISG